MTRNGDAVSHAEMVVYALLNKLGQLLAEVAVLRGVDDDEEPRHGYDQGMLVFFFTAVLNEANKILMVLRVDSAERVQEEARDLAYSIDDCIDLFITHIKRAVVNPEALQEAQNIISSEMPDIIARIGALSSTSTPPGQPGGLARSLTLGSTITPRSSTEGSAGTEDPIAVLAKMVVATEDPDAKLKTLGVVGPKGLGTATTMLEEVRRRLEEEFDCTANVLVSQAFSGNQAQEVCELLKNVLQQVVKVRTPGAQEEEVLRGIDFMEEDELETTLQEYLEDKRYLILIEGVCTVEAWEGIRRRFSNNDRRSRIVVSTEMEAVAAACSRVYRLNQQDAECKGLAFTARSAVVSGADDPEKNIVSRQAQARLVPTPAEMGILFKRRYDLLQPILKQCMLHLSLFPKGYAFNRERLFNRWMAEEVVAYKDVKQGGSLYDLAHSCMEKLVGKDLVEYVRTGYWDATCQVPDAMHKVIVDEAINTTFACLVGALQGSTRYKSDKVRTLSIVGDDPAASLEGKNMRFLRSLSMFQQQDRHKLLDRLAEFTYLRMLDLEGCTVVEDRHVKLVCKLLLLKFLSFRDTGITVVPAEIGALGNLQTLDVYDTLLTGLPDTVTDLVNLERLYFSNKHRWDAVWRLPRGLKKMKALCTVSKAGLTDDVQVAQEIGELAQLEELGLILFNSGAVLDEVAQALGKRARDLQMLHIVDNSSDGKTLNLLLNIPSPPLQLQYIRIAGAINKFPDWFKMLRELTEISLSATELHSDQILGALCLLPSLLSISLWRNSYTDSELIARAEYKFPKLNVLSVTSDYNQHKFSDSSKVPCQHWRRWSTGLTTWTKTLLASST
ncbi:unnamed protein product [Urochloa decumbens]|uniref:Uncharacterized protein n=1 Tax=Urochloa decumbens TaxID=240449 RepID=A0ABC9B6C7_9POAL